MLWLGIHLGIALALLLFPFYQKITSILSLFLTSCVLHDRFALYCPLCGGTRALQALLTGDIGAAFSLNPLVTLLFFAALAWDLRALIFLLRGKAKIFRLPTWVWIVLIGVTLLYGVLRNILLVTEGYDPLGDLVEFWHP